MRDREGEREPEGREKWKKETAGWCNLVLDAGGLPEMRPWRGGLVLKWLAVAGGVETSRGGRIRLPQSRSDRVLWEALWAVGSEIWRSRSGGVWLEDLAKWRQGTGCVWIARRAAATAGLEGVGLLRV